MARTRGARKVHRYGAEFELRRVRALLERYCAARVPPHVRQKLTVGFAVGGGALTLFEMSGRAPDYSFSSP